jgi:hypothetical protein
VAGAGAEVFFRGSGAAGGGWDVTFSAPAAYLLSSGAGGEGVTLAAAYSLSSIIISASVLALG